MTQNYQSENLRFKLNDLRNSFENFHVQLTCQSADIASILGNVYLGIPELDSDIDFRNEAQELFTSFTEICTLSGISGEDLATEMNSQDVHIQELLEQYVLNHPTYKELENQIEEQDKTIDSLEEELRIYREIDETITDDAVEIPPVTLFGRARAWFKCHFGSSS